MKDKPDLIINTGDTVMDEQTVQRDVTTRCNTWQKIVTPDKIKIYSALGNHDVWNGPTESLDNEYRKEKGYGKQWAMEMLSMTDRYYSFDMKGWQFIALDSINGKEGYQLDNTQFEWLQAQLQSIPANKPILVFNHVPIISVGALMYLTQRHPAAETTFPSGDMHLDHQRIKNIFFKHKNAELS